MEAPWLSNGLGLDIMGCRDITVFEEVLPKAIDRLFEWGTSDVVGEDAEALELIHTLGVLVGWHCRDFNARVDFAHSVQRMLVGAAKRAADWLNVKRDESKRSGHKILWITWASVELSFRILRASGHADIDVIGALDDLLDQTLIQLFQVDFSVVIKALRHADASSPIQNHSVDVWVCLIHIHAFLHDNYSLSTFWERILSRFADQSWLPPPQFQGELIWTTAFVATTLSHFSLDGTVRGSPVLPSCWPLVSLAISHIRLSEDPSLTISPRILEQRDLYIRGLLARCLMLRTRLGWSLTGSADLLNDLVAIFRSRKFNGLHGEPAGFPSFVSNPETQGLFDDFDPHDAAFDLFLKLIMGAIRDARRDLPTDGAAKITKRVLSLALPVGSAQFSRTNPPTERELSGLYNRYSAMLVAADVDAPSFSVRLQQAQRYSNFGEADWMSRQATIRAMMYFGIFATKERLGSEKVLAWITLIEDCLLTELNQFDRSMLDVPENQKRNFWAQLLKTVQLSIGSIRLIYKSAPDATPPLYPDPTLLRAGAHSDFGPVILKLLTDISRMIGWLSDLLSTSIANDRSTTQEIRELVLTFLSRRLATLPSQMPAHVAPSEESQEDYGDFLFNLNDPALLALTGVEVPPPGADHTFEESQSVEAMECLGPVIYNLINRQFSSEDPSSIFNDDSLDLWVECWAGCAQVLVSNNKHVSWIFNNTEFQA